MSETERMSRKGQREREGEGIPSRLHTVSTEPNARLELTNCEIMTRAKFKSQRLNQLSPLSSFLDGILVNSYDVHPS